MQFRKKPVVIDATQWFKNGDHPADNATEMFDYPDGQRPAVIREGEVVRYYRHPEVSGDSLCEQCGKPHHVHGWIDTLEQGHRVCPGDWIITGVKGERYPCKPDIFAATYELPTPTTAEKGAVDLARLQRYGFDGSFGGDFGAQPQGPYVKLDDVRALLAAQPVAQVNDKPVATVIKKGAERQWMSENLGALPDGTYSLYLAPVASKEAVPVWQVKCPKSGWYDTTEQDARWQASIGYQTRMLPAAPTIAAEGVPSVDTREFDDLMAHYLECDRTGTSDDTDTAYEAIVAHLNADKAAAVAAERARVAKETRALVDALVMEKDTCLKALRERNAELAKMREQKPVGTVRVTHKGYAMSLATYIAYALPEGDHAIYADPSSAKVEDGKPLDAQEAAKPSEGSSDDERAKFEKWLRETRNNAAIRLKGTDQYVVPDVQAAWVSWQARAALAQPAEPGGSDVLRNALEQVDGCMDETQVEPEDAAAWQIVRAEFMRLFRVEGSAK